MITVDIKWSQKSITDLIANLNKLGMDINSNAGAWLTEIAENIMAESKAEVPYDTGTLQSSAYIDKPRNIGDKTIVRMGYGGLNDKKNPDSGKMASQYALTVHETKEYRHHYGKWKFLEHPVRRAKKMMNSILKLGIRAMIQKAGARRVVR